MSGLDPVMDFFFTNWLRAKTRLGDVLCLPTLRCENATAVLQLLLINLGLGHAAGCLLWMLR
jgi:hypothetical protein